MVLDLLMGSSSYADVTLGRLPFIVQIEKDTKYVPRCESLSSELSLAPYRVEKNNNAMQIITRLLGGHFQVHEIRKVQMCKDIHNRS